MIKLLLIINLFLIILLLNNQNKNLLFKSLFESIIVSFDNSGNNKRYYNSWNSQLPNQLSLFFSKRFLFSIRGELVKITNIIG